MYKSVVFIVASALLHCANPYKILALFPYGGRSHNDVYEPLLITLSRMGHEIVVASHFAPPVNVTNWHHVDLNEKGIVHTSETTELEQFSSFFGRFGHFFDTVMLAEFSMYLCSELTKNANVQYMLFTKMRFDLILTEDFISDCGFGVAYLFDAPVVALQSHALMPWSYDKYDQPDNPAYMPSLFSRFGCRMSFMQRLENTLYEVLYKLIYEYYVARGEREMIQNNLNCSIPPLWEVSKNISVLLTNTHYILNGVKPLMPSVVEVGGMHIRKTLNPLNPDMEKFINESTHGVILFSMGSMIKASSFDPIKLQAFVETFAELKQRIIWKWEADPPPGLSENVYIVKWAQQMEILNHPKTVAFISHGGLLGTTEAVNAGIPMLFLPVYGDQFVNSAAGEENGLGISVPYTEITKEKIQAALRRITSPEMKASAESLSREWRDRRDPLLVAVEEVERVAKHGGKRRRSPARELSTYQILLLDVIGFLALVSIVILYSIYKFVSILLRIALYFVGGKSSTKKKKD